MTFVIPLGHRQAPLWSAVNFYRQFLSWAVESFGVRAVYTPDARIPLKKEHHSPPPSTHTHIFTRLFSHEVRLGLHCYRTGQMLSIYQSHRQFRCLYIVNVVITHYICIKCKQINIFSFCILFAWIRYKNPIWTSLVTYKVWEIY